MSTPMVNTNFAELHDIRFQRIANEEYDKHPDIVEKLFTNQEHNGRDSMTFNAVSAIGDFRAFNGSVTYNDLHMMYTTEMFYQEFTNGFQVERRLFDDDQYHIFDAKPKQLARSAWRLKQEHGARVFNSAFSVDTLFYTQEEGKALCSDTHLTTTGASTASGFDNVITGALTATSVATGRIQMCQLVGTQGERIRVEPDILVFPPGKYEQAFEIVKSPGKLDTANNNGNVHEGRYKLIEWNYLTSANNWFMIDETLMKDHLLWSDRIPLEYGFIEDFETFAAKYRAYKRHAWCWTDWRWILGSNVA